jgi:hypothetical protein
MQSRNKREGYYFGKGCDFTKARNGWMICSGDRRHKRIKEFRTSLKGFFKGLKK